MLLAVPAALAVLATLGLGGMVARTTLSLSQNVEVTQDLVDGNVRTLSQVQRELLRLEDVVAEVPVDRDEVELHRALVAQRVQESTLDYQGRVLTPALLQRARSLADDWRTDLEPSVRSLAEGRSSADEVRRLADALLPFEVRYNQLVSDAENARKVQAAGANAATASLVDNARWLLGGLVVTLVSLIALVAGMVRVFSDARARQVTAAQGLRDARALLQRHAVAVQSTDNLVVVTDEEGRVEWVNDAFTRRTGYVLEDLLGRTPGSVLQGPGTDREVVSMMRSRLAEQREFSCQLLNYTKAGEEYWVEIDVHPIVEDGCGTTGFVSVQSDITQRRQTEEALVRAKETAELSARDKAGFLASMSHEIRTPLNAVIGLTELLLDTPLGAEQRTWVETALQSGRHLLTLVNDILDFSALDADRVEIESHPVVVEDLVSDVERMLRPAADRAGLRLLHTVSPDVPAVLCTDLVRVRQVLINLVGNGLKFTRTGGVSVDVSYLDAADGDGGLLSLSVTDTGEGIPPERLARIFQPFTQGDASTTRTHGGTGLGLAICTRIADRMRGRLAVESRVGSGSVFTLTVPVRLCPTSVADAPVPSPGEAVDVTALRVLLVEDDAVNRMVALHMLRRAGLEADVAVDGVEAVERATSTDYDVLLMDVHMPRLDGPGATRAVRARGGHQPRIVALTANALEGDRERLLAIGMDDYLSKPYQFDDLLAVLVQTARARRGPLHPAPERVSADEPVEQAVDLRGGVER